MISNTPANASDVGSVGSILIHCLRRWPNIDPTAGLVFKGNRTEHDCNGELCNAFSSVISADN